MVDWNKLIENGKKCGVEYTFYDDVKLNKCRCGGTARIYSERNDGKPHSFEHFSIRCGKCNNSISGVYDVSGNPSEAFPDIKTAMSEKIKEWNEQCESKTN